MKDYIDKLIYQLIAWEPAGLEGPVSEVVNSKVLAIKEEKESKEKDSWIVKFLPKNLLERCGIEQIRFQIMDEKDRCCTIPLVGLSASDSKIAEFFKIYCTAYKIIFSHIYLKEKWRRRPYLEFIFKEDSMEVIFRRGFGYEDYLPVIVSRDGRIKNRIAEIMDENPDFKKFDYATFRKKFVTPCKDQHSAVLTDLEAIIFEYGIKGSECNILADKILEIFILFASLPMSFTGPGRFGYYLHSTLADLNVCAFYIDSNKQFDMDIFIYIQLLLNKLGKVFGYSIHKSKIEEMVKKAEMEEIGFDYSHVLNTILSGAKNEWDLLALDKYKDIESGIRERLVKFDFFWQEAMHYNSFIYKLLKNSKTFSSSQLDEKLNDEIKKILCMELLTLNPFMSYKDYCAESRHKILEILSETDFNDKLGQFVTSINASKNSFEGSFLDILQVKVDLSESFLCSNDFLNFIQVIFGELTRNAFKLSHGVDMVISKGFPAEFSVCIKSLENKKIMIGVSNTCICEKNVFFGKVDLSNLKPGGLRLCYKLMKNKLNIEPEVHRLKSDLVCGGDFRLGHFEWKFEFDSNFVKEVK